MSDEVNRAVFISGDAVTVLPYDPRRDRVLLIEQFRAGPFARGDDQPWLLEAIAGRESIRARHRKRPPGAKRARRRGSTLGELLPIGELLPLAGGQGRVPLLLPGASTDLPDGVAGTFGAGERGRGYPRPSRCPSSA